MASSELCGLSLCEAADLIRDGKVSAGELLAATFDQIDRLEPIYHAFVWQDRERATVRARALDADRAAGKTVGPLHGVPMAHKDMYYRAGRVSTFGSRVPGNRPAKTTSVALQKLDEAGAIEVGGLAMVEFAMGPHGYNANLPRALNPWGHDRVPCGSSSGSGVAVSTRMAFASLGSDTGGSIRCPAAANGIVGCLPTSGLVSRRGSMAMSWSLDCVGPLTRTARDAARVLTTIAEPATDYEAGIERNLSGLRIGVPRGYFDERLDPAVDKAMSASLDVLREAGAVIVPVKISGIRRAGVEPASPGDEGRGRRQSPAVEAHTGGAILGRSRQTPRGGLLHSGNRLHQRPAVPGLRAGRLPRHRHGGHRRAAYGGPADPDADARPDRVSRRPGLSRHGRVADA